MKIYGNPKSDSFPLFMALIGGLFGVGAWAMVNVHGSMLALGLVVFGVLTAGMLVAIRRWDVMSEPAVAGDSTGTPVRLPNFPVAAQTDAKPEAAPSVWAPSATILPQQVETPKPAVETNALPV